MTRARTLPEEPGPAPISVRGLTVVANDSSFHYPDAVSVELVNGRLDVLAWDWRGGKAVLPVIGSHRVDEVSLIINRNATQRETRNTSRSTAPVIIDPVTGEAVEVTPGVLEAYVNALEAAVRASLHTPPLEDTHADA